MQSPISVPSTSAATSAGTASPWAAANRSASTSRVGAEPPRGTEHPLRRRLHRHRSHAAVARITGGTMCSRRSAGRPGNGLPGLDSRGAADASVSRAGRRHRCRRPLRHRPPAPNRRSNRSGRSSSSPAGRTVPHSTTLMKITERCGQRAVDGLNEALLAKAHDQKLVRLDRVRADTTVVEANVAYPTDSGLLARAWPSSLVSLGRCTQPGLRHGHGSGTGPVRCRPCP